MNKQQSENIGAGKGRNDETRTTRPGTHTNGSTDPTGGAAPNDSKANGTGEPKPNIPDPLDPESFRLPPEGAPGSGVEVQPVKLKIRKPKKTEFFRCHPELRMMAAVLEKEEGFDKVFYLAAPAVATMNVGELRKVELCLCSNRDGTLFVWPIPQPGESGKSNDWGVSARAGAHTALTSWVRLKSDQPNGQYVVIVAKAKVPEGAWPQPPMTLRDMLARAFGDDHLMHDEDHPELKALRGE